MEDNYTLKIRNNYTSQVRGPPCISVLCKHYFSYLHSNAKK